jgi:hypothetical protein
MNALRKSQLEFAEWDLFRSALNEVTHGFSKSVGDFEAVIGLPKADLEQFLDHLCSLPESAVVDLDQRWVLVFRNSLSAALQLIPESEFETRTGHESTEARNILKKLDNLAIG